MAEELTIDGHNFFPKLKKMAQTFDKVISGLAFLTHF